MTHNHQAGGRDPDSERDATTPRRLCPGRPEVRRQESVHPRGSTAGDALPHLPHLKAEFDRQRTAAQDAGQQPDTRLAQIERLKAEVATLRERLSRKNVELDALKEFQVTALSRIAAQQDAITSLRRELEAAQERRLRPVPRR